MGMRSTSTYPDDMEDYEVKEERVIDAGSRRMPQLKLDAMWCGNVIERCRREKCAMWVGDAEDGDCCHKVAAEALHYLATEKCAGR